MWKVSESGDDSVFVHGAALVACNVLDARRCIQQVLSSEYLSRKD